MLPTYVVDGPDGAPLLVLGNSLGTSGDMWGPQLAALRQRFRVVRYEHRGHGGTAAPDGPYTIDELGGDLVELLDHLEADRASLCGLSLGGMVAHVGRSPPPGTGRPLGAGLHRTAAAPHRAVGRTGSHVPSAGPVPAARHAAGPLVHARLSRPPSRRPSTRRHHARSRRRRRGTRAAARRSAPWTTAATWRRSPRRRSS